MRLQINNKHKKMDLSKIKIYKKGLIGTAFGLSALLVFSGSKMQIISNNQNTNIQEQKDIDYSSVKDNTIINIPKNFKKSVAIACGKEEDNRITVGDLRKIKDSLSIGIRDDSSLEWLNYCDNLNELTIYLKTDYTQMFESIKSIKNLNTISILNSEITALSLNEFDFSFLKNSNLEKMTVTGMDIPKNFIESLTSLKTFVISPFIYDNIDIDYSKLTFLDELYFECGAYDAAIKLNTEEYNILSENGVSIQLEETDVDNLEYVNASLDLIVNSIGVVKNSSDQEKLDAILIYVLENLSYDKEVAQGKATPDKINSFYEGGLLYGALEKDTAICGNYASLISALSDRLNLNTYYITSYNHAWNLVSIEGVNYYVDATWFDGLAAKIDVNLTAEEAINLGKNEELDWYMEEPRNDYDDTHKAIDIPLFVKVTSITSDDNSFENFEEKQFKIEIGSKIFVVGGGILIGIMCGLGLAYISKGKQKKFDLNSFENSNIREAENYNFNESVSHKKR